MLTEGQLRVQEEVFVLPVVREALPLPGGELGEVIELRTGRVIRAAVSCVEPTVPGQPALAWGAWNS